MKAVFTFSEAEVKLLIAEAINESCCSILDGEVVKFDWEHEGDDAVLVVTIENWEG